MINLIVNAGSATTKYSFYCEGEKLLHVKYQKKDHKGYEVVITKDGISQAIDVSKAVFDKSFSDLFKRSIIKTLLSELELNAIGFRVVHGGQYFDEPVHVTSQVLSQLKKLDHLAPLHNPHARKLIEEAEKNFPEIEKLLVQLFFFNQINTLLLIKHKFLIHLNY